MFRFFEMVIYGILFAIGVLGGVDRLVIISIILFWILAQLIEIKNDMRNK